MPDAPADTPPEAPERAVLYPRHDETFPQLAPEEIERLRRFGSEQSFRDGEVLFRAGEPGPGMFVVLSGQVAISQRDGLGRRQALVEQGPGQFIAEAGQLSGRPALVDGIAEGDVETILIPPAGLRALLVAEAGLGERITRALILRRVQLIQSGDGGPLVIGEPEDADVLRLATFLRRNGHPYKIVDPATDLAAAGLLSHCQAGAAGLPLVVTPSGDVLHNPSIADLGRALGLLGRGAAARAVRRGGGRRGAGAGFRPRSTAHRRGCRSRCSTSRAMAGRPARARGSRTISAFRPASPARR